MKTLRTVKTILLLIASISAICAQRIIVNSNGERIVMYPDGSWRLVEAGDSILLRQNLQKSEILGLENENMEASEARTIGEQEEYILKQWNELHFKIKAQEKKIQNEFRAATNAHFKANELLQNAETIKGLVEPDRLASLHEDYEKSIKVLRQAKSNQLAIKKLLEKSKQLGGMPPKDMERKLNSLRAKFNLFISEYDPRETVLVSEKKISTPKISGKKTKPEKFPKSPGPDISVSKSNEENFPPALRMKTYESEPFNCNARSDTVDEATGRRRIELERALIFTHTDPDLRPYFKDKELITCYGTLSKIDAYVYLMIDFQIASSHSQSNFGSLSNGSLLRLQLLSGEYVSLYNIKSDRGRIDPYSGYTVFTGQYALGKNEIKMLQSSELDKIRILWSTGYEDYDVYKIDFFLDQLKCLMNK